MGMDVYGKNPENETGRYFRASVWGWHPLAEYLTEVAPDLIGKVTYLHSNDGDGLGQADSVTLASALQRALTSGHTRRTCRRRMQRSPPCPASRASSARERAHGPIRSASASGTRERGWCNGCDGKGDREAWEASYSLSTALVREFAAFVRHSGGFEIW